MSSGAAIANAVPGTNAGILPGGPGSYQAQQAQSPTPSSFDAVSPTPEAVTVPLMPNMAGDAASVDASTSSASVQSPGMAAVAILTGLFVLGAAFGGPIAMELANTRAKTKLALKREEFEHTIHDAHLSAKDPTLQWVRDLEKKHVDGAVVALLAAEMKGRWDDFATEREAYNKGPKGAAEQDRLKEKFARLQELEIPVAHANGSPLSSTKQHDTESITKAKISEEKPPVKEKSLRPHAALVTNMLYHRYLKRLKSTKSADGDNLRLLQIQTRGHVSHLLGHRDPELDALERGGRGQGRIVEFDEKLLSLHEKALGHFLTDGSVRNTGTARQPAGDKNDGFPIERATGHLEPELRADIAANMRKFIDFKQRHTAIASLEELGFTNLATGTFEKPRGARQIEACAEHFRKNGDLVLSMLISADMLDLVHPGSTEHAMHLHPSQPGLSTGSHEDMKKVRIVWRYHAPKKGELHPEPIKISDGSLVAAWLVSEEKEANLKPFHDHEARTQDLLGGNEHALEKGMFTRIFRGVMYRFCSYGRGIKEGMSTPRYNGVIAANLIINGLAISSFLYTLCYGVDYLVTQHEIANHKKDHKHKHQHHQQSNASNDNNLNGAPYAATNISPFTTPLPSAPLITAAA